jgi:NADH dehydrogenase/NADH:ubiquinone oxidoreductase subunit G
MVNLTIDGRKLQAEAGRTLLEAALDNKIAIPTLCYHEGLPGYGACRLCIVAIERHGRERLVVSCLYPVEERLVVKTSTPRVDSVRRMVLDLLLARCPDSDVIKNLAAQYGVEKSSFRPESGNNKCILCGLCTRVCQDTVGASAISLVNRGVERKVATPFETFSESCIACGSCAFVCPTGAITVKDEGDTRVITMPHVTMEFKLKQCLACGRYWAPERQLAFMCRQAGLAEDFYDKCPDCRD